MKYNSNLRWSWLFILIFFLDQFTKWWVEKNLVPGISVPIMPFLQLTIAHNHGAAFSLLNQASGWQSWFFSAMAIGISFLLGSLLLHVKRVSLIIAIIAVIAGACGNLFDRLTRGFVVDFIDCYVSSWHWPIFNIADTAICIGSVVMFIYASDISHILEKQHHQFRSRNKP